MMMIIDTLVSGVRLLADVLAVIGMVFVAYIFGCAGIEALRILLMPARRDSADE